MSSVDLPLCSGFLFPTEPTVPWTLGTVALLPQCPQTPTCDFPVAQPAHLAFSEGTLSMSQRQLRTCRQPNSGPVPKVQVYSEES